MGAGCRDRIGCRYINRVDIGFTQGIGADRDIIVSGATGGEIEDVIVRFVEGNLIGNIEYVDSGCTIWFNGCARDISVTLSYYFSCPISISLKLSILTYE